MSSIWNHSSSFRTGSSVAPSICSSMACDSLQEVRSTTPLARVDTLADTVYSTAPSSDSIHTRKDTWDTQLGDGHGDSADTLQRSTTSGDTLEDLLPRTLRDRFRKHRDIFNDDYRRVVHPFYYDPPEPTRFPTRSAQRRQNGTAISHWWSSGSSGYSDEGRSD